MTIEYRAIGPFMYSSVHHPQVGAFIHSPHDLHKAAWRRKEGGAEWAGL